MADVTVKYKDVTIAEMSIGGTKTLKTCGKYCEDDITVDYVPPTPVAVEVNCKSYDITLSKASGWVLLRTLEDEVLAHINDPTFTVLLAIKDIYAYEWYAGSMFACSNIPCAMQSGYPVYGYANRQTNETTTSAMGIYYPANNTGTDDSLGGNGIFRVDGTKYYLKPGDGFIRGGNYRLVFTW